MSKNSSNARYVTVRTSSTREPRHYWQRRGYPLERLPDDLDERRKRIACLNAWADGRAPIEPNQEGVTPHHSAVETAMLGSIARAEQRAKDRGWEFDLTLPKLSSILERQNWCCALTGLPFKVDRDITFDDGTLTVSGRDPFAPSIDRIDSTKGYTASNVRVVCLAVNVALSDWGDDVFLTIARAAIARADARLR